LLASTQAIRFSEPGSNLSFNEDEALVRPIMIAQNVMPGSNNQMSQTFSQALKNDRNPEEDMEFRKTLHSKSPVIQ
jgi:hypothetical protein